MASPSARVALFWSFAERYLGLMISIASTMVLARLLTPGEVGIYSMCAAFTAVAGILRDFGVSEYIIQEKELTRGKLRSAYAVAFIVAWSIGLVAFASRDVLAEFYKEPRVAEVMLVLTLHFLILPVSSPTFAMLNRNLAFRQVFFLQIACNGVQAVTSVTLAYLGFGVMSLAWGPIANVATQTVILALLHPKDLLILPGLGEVRTVLRFGSLYVASRTIEVLTRNVHEPLLGKFYDFASVGLFSRAFGLIELFYHNVTHAVVRVATPAFAAAHRAGQPVGEVFTSSTALFTSVAWSFFGVVAVTSGHIIGIMFGDQWLPAAPIASWLALGMVPYSLTALVPQLMAATGHVKRRLQVTLMYSPVHIVAVVIALPHSLEAVAASWTLSFSVQALLYGRHLHQALGVRFRDLLRACLPSALVAASVTLSCFAVDTALHVQGFPALLSLVASFALSAWVWLVAVWALRHPAFAEVRRLAAGLRQRAKAPPQPRSEP